MKQLVKNSKKGQNPKAKILVVSTSTKRDDRHEQYEVNGRKVPEQLLSFLKEENIYHMFFDNIERSKTNREMFMLALRKSSRQPQDIILKGFCWTDSNEDSYFWDDIHKAYKRYCRELLIKQELDEKSKRDKYFYY